MAAFFGLSTSADALFNFGFWKTVFAKMEEVRAFVAKLGAFVGKVPGDVMAGLIIGAVALGLIYCWVDAREKRLVKRAQKGASLGA